MSRSITFFTLHLNILDLIFHFDFSDHFSRTATNTASVKGPWGITSTFAVFTNLSSSEFEDSFASSVESWKRNGHFGSEITSFGFGSLLNLRKALFSKKIVGVSFGDIDEDFICSLDFDECFLYFLVTGISVGMVLNREFSEGFFDLVAGGFRREFE